MALNNLIWLTSVILISLRGDPDLALSRHFHWSKTLFLLMTSLLTNHRVYNVILYDQILPKVLT